MNFTFNQLRIFQKVAESLSITRAAQELHLTQPAVSIQLKNFQAQFELPLIDVVGKKVYLTDFGKSILESVEKILAEVKGMELQVHRNEGYLTGKLKISVVSTGQYVAPFFVSGFIKQHPGVELIMDVTNKNQVVNSLEKNEVDFSLVTIVPEQLSFEKIELLKNKLFLVASGTEKFEQGTHDHSIFELAPLIYRESGSGTRFVMEKYIKRYNLPVRRKLELTSNEAVKQAVIAGLGFSIMPLIGIKNELLNNQLQIIPVKGFPIQSTWHLIHLKNKKNTPIAAAFLEYIQQEKKKIIQERFDWYERY
jgi:DNA-binding transcriptional LysR family regulator